jgi:hypothetical protein
VADRGADERELSPAEPADPAIGAPADPAPGADAPAAPAAPVTEESRWRRTWNWVVRYFTEQDPTFWVAFTPALIVAALLFVRSPASNYIFDEQEALLANPYVNGEVRFWQVFQRDFWGLPPERSIGSYRPVPNLIWRTLWYVSELPWLHHWINVVLHAVNGAVLSSFAFALTKRRALSWLIGAIFVSSAVLTEAITGVVGLADVLGGLGVLLALSALRSRLALAPLGVLGATLLGLFSKESVLVAVPLVTWAALVTAPALHPQRPRRVLRALLALLATVVALVAYTEFRRRFFPVSMPAEFDAPLPRDKPLLSRAMHEFLRWFQQPRLPHDRINNPLVDADFPHRVAGALRVYVRGLVQVVFPWRRSGDYSFQAEPVPSRLIFPESVLGGLLLGVPPLAGIGVWIAAIRRERRTSPLDPRVATLIALALALVWVPIAYFPHSNIPTLLPTVRAERFWYLPVIGAAFGLAVPLAAFARIRWRALAIGGIATFFAIQAVQARLHALDYTDDLVFWRETRDAVPRSAKAQLNYSVMVGAHENDLEFRLKLNAEALRLAPEWPMAHVYYGDTLCRLQRANEAWPHYARGFALAPGDPNLIALGLQCLWDKKAIASHREELLDLADRHPGTWLSYLASDIVYNGEKHKGVDPKYRPRGYDEGPKKR